MPSTSTNDENMTENTTLRIESNDEGKLWILYNVNNLSFFCLSASPSIVVGDKNRMFSTSAPTMQTTLHRLTKLWTSWKEMKISPGKQIAFDRLHVNANVKFKSWHMHFSKKTQSFYICLVLFVLFSTFVPVSSFVRLTVCVTLEANRLLFEKVRHSHNNCACDETRRLMYLVAVVEYGCLHRKNKALEWTMAYFETQIIGMVSQPLWKDQTNQWV